MKKVLVFLNCFILLAGVVFPQEIKTHDHTISLNFLQIKEQMNYGLAFKGPGLGYTYSAQWQNDARIFDYEGRISFNAVWTRDIVAPSLNLVPARFDYLFKTGADGKICIGPYAIMEYNYELYPDLQSAYSFWFTHYSMGCALTGWFNIKESRIDLSLHVTAFGFTSRQPEIDDPYFYDAGFGTMIRNLHSDFRFGSLNLYNNTELELRWTPKPGSRLAFAYLYQYYAYTDEPTLKMINQSVKLIFLPTKNK